LKKPDSFWPWLCGIALNKIRRHHHSEARHRKIVNPQQAKDYIAQRTPHTRDEALAAPVTKEIEQYVLESLRTLKPRHRAVLTMRCLDNMPYPQIAQTLQCREVAARMLFHRARKALQKQLSKRGFTSGALLSALVLFGKLTAPTQAAAAKISVTSAALKTGLTATLLASVTSKTALITLAATSAVTVSSILVVPPPKAEPLSPLSSSAKITRYDHQIDLSATSSWQGWYYYPHGVSGPVMTRFLIRDTRSNQPQREFLQNDETNAFFDHARNTLYLHNHHPWLSDLSIMPLPSDTPELTRVLAGSFPNTPYIESTRPTGRNLLIAVKNTSRDSSGQPLVTIHPNALQEEYFSYNWPADADIIDNRDPMHKRGWTFFRATGQIKSAPVTGKGRIPFTYKAYQTHTPWMTLNITGQSPITRTSFNGLSRPWMGLHTIDTIRRDAAKRGIWFETRQTENKNVVEIELIDNQQTLVYSVNLTRDVIEKITFLNSNQQIQGELKFDYLDWPAPVFSTSCYESISRILPFA